MGPDAYCQGNAENLSRNRAQGGHPGPDIGLRNSDRIYFEEMVRTLVALRVTSKLPLSRYF